MPALIRLAVGTFDDFSLKKGIEISDSTKIPLAPRGSCTARPCHHVPRAGAVTGFAADVDLGPACLEFIGGGIVILAHVGGVAVGAHEVPILRRTRPVKLVLMSDPLTGVKVKPALPAFILRPRVPRDGQRLKPTIRELDQVLLQW